MDRPGQLLLFCELGHSSDLTSVISSRCRVWIGHLYVELCREADVSILTAPKSVLGKDSQALVLSAIDGESRMGSCNCRVSRKCTFAIGLFGGGRGTE